MILANAQTVVTGQVLEWAERALVARGWKGARPRPAGAWAGADGEVLATEKGFRLVALKGRRGRKTLAVVLAGQKEKMPAGVGDRREACGPGCWDERRRLDPGHGAAPGTLSAGARL